MTLRRKTLVIIGATLLGLLITFFVLTRVTLLRRLREYEAQQTRREVQRASTALETEISQLDTIVRDDAVWDEAYEFVQHPNRKFLESNFPRAIFSDLRIDLVIFLNSSDEVIFERLADHPLDPTLQQALDKKLLQPGVLVRPASAEAIVSGIINLPDGPTMVSASQILRSSGEGPSRGTLIMGRRLNANEIHRLSLLTRLDLQVYPFDDPRLPADFQASLSGGQETPGNASPAFGQAQFWIGADGTSLSYSARIFGLANPVAAHLHLGSAGTAVVSAPSYSR